MITITYLQLVLIYASFLATDIVLKIIREEIKLHKQKKSSRITRTKLFKYLRDGK